MIAYLGRQHRRLGDTLNTPIRTDLAWSLTGSAGVRLEPEAHYKTIKTDSSCTLKVRLLKNQG